MGKGLISAAGCRSCTGPGIQYISALCCTPAPRCQAAAYSLTDAVVTSRPCLLQHNPPPTLSWPLQLSHHLSLPSYLSRPFPPLPFGVPPSHVRAPQTLLAGGPARGAGRPHRGGAGAAVLPTTGARHPTPTRSLPVLPVSPRLQAPAAATSLGRKACRCDTSTA